MNAGYRCDHDSRWNQIAGLYFCENNRIIKPGGILHIAGYQTSCWHEQFDSCHNPCQYISITGRYWCRHSRSIGARTHFNCVNIQRLVSLSRAILPSLLITGNAINSAASTALISPFRRKSTQWKLAWDVPLINWVQHDGPAFCPNSCQLLVTTWFWSSRFPEYPLSR